MQRLLFLVGLPALSLASCELFDLKGGDTGTVSEGDADGDSDSDGDSDADSDSDSDLCDQDLSETVAGSDCVTREISCGETVYGTTEGSVSSWDGSAYQAWYCLISTSTQYTGSERVYEFWHPGTGDVTFTLNDACGNLDMFALNWSETSSCPTGDYSIIECEATDGTNDFVVWHNQVTRYLVFVDGPTGDEGNFSLSVDCP